ncbi:protein kinase, ATP binding site-containing protein, partial [Tanacetum coccineum]
MVPTIKQFEHLKLTLEAIKSATKNLTDENCIGRGGFGKVYKGEIDNTMVALRLDREFGQVDPEFWKEIMMLSVYKHENIVYLLGYCDDYGEKILMYEYLPKESLNRYLKSSELTWVRRLKICIGAARGLEYLHAP